MSTSENIMKTIQKTALASAAALAVIGGTILTPLTANGAPALSPATDHPVVQQDSSAGQSTSDERAVPAPSTPAADDRVPLPKQQPQHRSRTVQQSSGLSCPGTQPRTEYDKDGRLTQDSARRLLAAGCSATDGSELNEVANPGLLGGPSSPDRSAASTVKPGVTQPKTGLPRVAG